jgi:isoleucyl-tRNA synthetase
MSKHLGNILDPFELMAKHGADAVRWLLLCVGNPWSARRVGSQAVDEVVRKVLLTYWNTVSFFTLYASIDGWTPTLGSGTPTVLDRWLRSELHRVVAEVDAALEEFDSTRAGRVLAEFVDDLSNWYVRRSRRRFWKGDHAAFATLHETLVTLTKLLAPFVPFLTEEVWGRLLVAPDSVHLAAWPEPEPASVDTALGAQMALGRRVVELGRQSRAEAKVKTRQPLGRALVGAAGWEALPEDLRAEIAEELNVAALGSLADETTVDVTVKPNFRALGARFGKDTPRVAAAVTAAGCRGGLLDVPGLGQVTIEPDEVVVTETPRSGWAVATEAGVTVALDLTVTPELRRAGLAREAVRLLQESRKSSGLAVTDRIEVWWEAGAGELAAALGEHGERVADEVLAVSFVAGRPAVDMAPHRDAELGLTWWLRPAGE